MYADKRDPSQLSWEIYYVFDSIWNFIYISVEPPLMSSVQWAPGIVFASTEWICPQHISLLSYSRVIYNADESNLQHCWERLSINSLEKMTIKIP